MYPYIDFSKEIFVWINREYTYLIYCTDFYIKNIDFPKIFIFILASLLGVGITVFFFFKLNCLGCCLGLVYSMTYRQKKL